MTIVLIIGAAAIVNRLVRRFIKRTLTRLGSGGLQERARSALRETDELSVRSEQRVEALTTVLRSIAGVVVWTFAGFMVLGQLGIDLGPLLAGAGVVGLAVGFGSQALVRDFLAGLFILVEDQFGVGDVVDVGEASGKV